MYARYSKLHLHIFWHAFIWHNYIVTLVWPPEGLRNGLVARGRKRLCTTDLPWAYEAFPLQPSDSPEHDDENGRLSIGRTSTKPISEKHNFTVEFLHPLIKIVANLIVIPLPSIRHC